jgi:hypothetical protein
MRKCFEFIFSLTFSFFFHLIDVATHQQSTTEQESTPQHTAQTHKALSLSQPARIITNGLFSFFYFYFFFYFLVPTLPLPSVSFFNFIISIQLICISVRYFSHETVSFNGAIFPLKNVVRVLFKKEYGKNQITAENF